ncbi:hypothetical protein AB4Y45_32910 [Paraburkholderia sp. EG287A]|uniref:hypothetical protein n=1 Tax=Paraburkholderia sp. EG287A TaxID=3237012 RepID=UPI0034D22C98
MTAPAAKVFRMALLYRLEAPYGGNLAAGNSADVLARELRDGIPGLLRVLEAESEGNVDANHAFSLIHMLTEAWTAKGDDQHLMNATGKTREEWLRSPFWHAEYRTLCHYAQARTVA